MIQVSLAACLILFVLRRDREDAFLTITVIMTVRSSRSTEKISSGRPKNELGHRNNITKNYLYNRLLVLVN